uniref:Uncharacterized protein n=1 Tax=Rhizophora mucronata TaxID=61149 RepID=A0A2P2NNA2_RHIMU
MIHIKRSKKRGKNIEKRENKNKGQTEHTCYSSIYF